MTHETVARIILIKLAHAVIYHGVKDREASEHFMALHKLQMAEDEEALSLPREKRESALRHAAKGKEAILQPYRDQNVHAASFGLALIYVLQELDNQGQHEPNAHFAKVIEEGLLHPEGSLVERHQSDKASASAIKMGRKLLTSLQSLGYFNEVVA